MGWIAFAAVAVVVFYAARYAVRIASPPLPEGYSVRTKNAGRSFQSLALYDPAGRELTDSFVKVFGYRSASRIVRRAAREHARHNFDPREG